MAEPTVRVEVCEHVDDLPDDALAGLRRPWTYTTESELARLEWVQPASVRYVVGTDRTGAVAAFLPVYLSSGPVSRECDPEATFGLRPAPERSTALLGAPGGHVNHLAVGREVPAGEAAAAAAAVVRVALDLAAAAGATVVVPHLLDWQREVLAGAGGPVLAKRVDHRAVLDLPGGGFDRYLARLPHRRRADVAAERRRFLDARRALREAPLSEVYEQAAPLVAAVETRYGRPYGAEQMAWYLASTAAAMGERGTALLLEDDGRLIAVSSLWQGGSDWHVRAWGCDYAALGRDGSYFSMTIYEPAVRAAAAGARQLHLGPGALAAKTRRGARLQPLHSLLLAAP